MNVSEASAYQSLLRWLSDIEASDVADDRAVTDLVWLAGRAHDTLGAGHTVVTASEEVAPKVLEHRELVRRALAGLVAAQESDGAAQAVCRALADSADERATDADVWPIVVDHQAHGGSIPWPSIRRPFEEWARIRAVEE